jgi:hypothetical protein
VPSPEHPSAKPPPIAIEPPTPTVSVTPSATSSAPPVDQRDAGDTTLSCRCDVLGFESDGPPRGECTLELSADGSAMLRGLTSSPPLTARLVPIVHGDAKQRAVDYVFDGEFQLSCDEPWCGKQELKVLRVAKHDYRVTVARSADGPPSHVLWVTCST